MAEVIQKNTAMVLGVAICGMIFALAAPAMRFDTGARGPSLLQAETPLVAILAVLGCMAIAVVVACIVGRVVNAAVGLFVLGAGVFVLANRGGTVEQLIFGGGSLGMLVVEALLWGALVLGATLVVLPYPGSWLILSQSHRGVGRIGC